MLVTLVHFAYLDSYNYQINFHGGGGVAGLIEIKTNSASQLELELELG